MKTTLKIFLTLAIMFVTFITLRAQTSLPSIKPDDYAKWQTLGSSSISDDGNWGSWHVSLVGDSASSWITSGKKYIEKKKEEEKAEKK